jgi:hypothetical protein
MTKIKKNFTLNQKNLVLMSEISGNQNTHKKNNNKHNIELK